MNKTLSIIFLLFIVTACTPTGKVTQEEAIKIGALLSLSGDAATFGQSTLEGAQMAIDEINEKGGINGKHVELVLETYSTLNTKQGLAGLHKLADQGITFIIGPTWDDIALADAANQRGVIMLATDVSESVERVVDYPYAYSIDYPVSAQMGAIAAYARATNKTRIAIIKDDNSWAEIITDVFKEQEGMNIVYEGANHFSEVDFRTQLLKMKEYKPDAVFAAFGYEEPRGPLLKQMSELGIHIPVYGAPSTETPQLLNDFGKYAESTVYYPLPTPTKETEAFYERYKERYGKEPTWTYVTNGYDAASIAIDTLASGASTVNEMKTKLDSGVFDSITYGSIEFTEKGYVKSSRAHFDIKTVQNGQYVVVA